MESAGAEPQPWERQPGETSRAFGAFTTYRDLGPRRGYEAVRVKTARKPSYIRVITRWSSAYQWVKRAEAWDAEQDRVVREARLQALRDGVGEMQERQVRSARRDQEALDVVARVFLERLERADKDLLGQLDTMPAEDFLRLVALATRARKVAVQVEWLARGVSPAALSGDVAEDGTAEEKALDQLLERVRMHPREDEA